MTLVGKTALVTGGSRGIGRGVALALAEAGAFVVLTYHMRREAALAVAAAIACAGGQADIAHLALEDTHGILKHVEALGVRHGGFDILVNNAAIVQPKPFLALTEADVMQMLAVNLFAPMACCQGVLPTMCERGWGRIVTVASIGAQVGGTGQPHYAAAKAGLLSITRSLARTFGREGVTVNAVAPDLVETELVAEELASPTGQARVQANPLGRVATVDEVAAAVAFLASTGASYVNGQVVSVNGGSYCG